MSFGIGEEKYKVKGENLILLFDGSTYETRT